MLPSELLQGFPIAIYLWHPTQCQHSSVPTIFFFFFGVLNPLFLTVNKFNENFSSHSVVMSKTEQYN